MGSQRRRGLLVDFLSPRIAPPIIDAGLAGSLLRQNRSHEIEIDGCDYRIPPANVNSSGRLGWQLDLVATVVPAYNWPNLASNAAPAAGPRSDSVVPDNIVGCGPARALNSSSLAGVGGSFRQVWTRRDCRG
jgi:hypothetical protein